MSLDDKNNIIEVCLFESYLAKYFIEHPEPFQSLMSKILDAIEEVIRYNADNPSFDRMLFAMFSIISQEHPDIKSMAALKQSKSIVVFDSFCKYFTEMIMCNSSVELPKMGAESPTSIPPLAQYSLFKSQQLGEKQLLEKMRPTALFSEANRGVIELDDIDHGEETLALGILSPTDTPDNLKKYFGCSHEPSRQYYKPKEDSLMAKWLRQHHLPVISGASGGIGKTLSKLNALIVLSTMENQLLGILIASSTIALGHHSFFEVIKPLSFVTEGLEEKDHLLAFYEQAIPEEIKRLPTYQAHIESHSGLIEEFIFGTPQMSPALQ